jgi:adenylate cyclase
MDQHLQSWPQRVAVVLISAAVGTALAAAVHAWEWLEPLDRRMTDWGFAARGTRGAHPDLALVLIDDAALQQAEAEYGSWPPLPRGYLADVIDALAAARPAVIALDVLLDDTGAGEGGHLTGDAARLRQSIEQAGNVVIAAQVVPGPDGRTLLLPHNEYAAAAAAVGATNFEQGRVDGLARWINLHPAGAEAPAHFAVHAVRLYREHRGETVSGPFDAVQELNFLGPPGTLSGSSTADLLQHRDELAPLFEDKIVCVGGSFRENPDFFRTPFNSPLAGPKWAKMPGVELLANSIHQLLTGEAIRTPLPAAVYVWAFLLAAVCAAGYLRLPLWLAAIATLLVLASAVTVALWQFIAAGLSLPVSVPLVATLAASTCSFACDFTAQRRFRSQLERIIGGYVSDEVFSYFMAARRTPELGGELRECTVLFSDIRDYGAISEQLRDDPHAIVELLNEHFSAMTECILRYRGSVNNFVGDLIMGVFGAPQPDPDHCYHAVCAGLDMLAAIEAQNAARIAAGRQPLEAGIGVHCGKVVAGNIGSPRRMNYTVIGDAVNVASRLESATKEFGAPLLASGELVAALQGRIDAVFIAASEVKSRVGTVDIYRVRGLGQAAPAEAADKGR